MRNGMSEVQHDSGNAESVHRDGPPTFALLRRLVEELTLGIVEIGDDWQVNYANPAAAILLLEDMALSTGAGRIRISPEQTFEEARQWLAEAAAGGPTSLAVARADGASAFLLEYLFGSPSRRGHVLAIIDSSRRLNVPPDRLSMAFGLTAAEAQLTAAIAAGGTIASIAAGRQVTEATVRTHLESVFAKTGARRQSQLVGLAAACALPLCSRAAPGIEIAESRSARRRNGRGGRPEADSASPSEGSNGQARRSGRVAVSRWRARKQ
jgi:DNA-binding CsgD family transcriptional regulator